MLGTPSASGEENRCQNCQRPTDEPPLSELRSETRWLFGAAETETRVFITSHQNPSKRRSFSRAVLFNESCGLAVRADWVRSREEDGKLRRVLASCGVPGAGGALL